MQYWPLPAELAASEDLLTAAGVDGEPGEPPATTGGAVAPSSAAAAASAAFLGHRPMATLTLRYIGKPLPPAAASSPAEPQAAGAAPAAAARGYHFAASLPTYLARQVGQGRILLGDESVDEALVASAAASSADAAAMAVDDGAPVAAAAAAEAGAAQPLPSVPVPWLVRTMARREGLHAILDRAVAAAAQPLAHPIDAAALRRASAPPPL